MARYDSPGFPDQIPGFAPRNSHDYGTAPGSDAGWHHSPPIPVGQVSGLPGVGAVLPLEVTNTAGSVDTLQPNQQDLYSPGARETFTNTALTPAENMPPAGGGDASSHVVTSPHMNSLGVNRA